MTYPSRHIDALLADIDDALSAKAAPPARFTVVACRPWP